MQKVKLVPLCAAAKLQDTRLIESVLDGAGIDYTFEITPMAGSSILGFLFGANKKGVMFLVPEEIYEKCLDLLDNAGLSHLLVK